MLFIDNIKRNPIPPTPFLYSLTIIARQGLPESTVITARRTDEKAISVFFSVFHHSLPTLYSFPPPLLLAAAIITAVVAAVTAAAAAIRKDGTERWR